MLSLEICPLVDDVSGDHGASMDYSKPTHAAIWRRNGEILDAVDSDSKVLFHAVEGKYCNLNGVGGKIWEILASRADSKRSLPFCWAPMPSAGKNARLKPRHLFRTLNDAGFVTAEISEIVASAGI